MCDLLITLIQDILTRAGWTLNHFNTFFDYWLGSLPSSVMAGKTIPGWSTVLGQSYHDVATPTLSDSVDEKDNVGLFVQN